MLRLLTFFHFSPDGRDRRFATLKPPVNICHDWLERLCSQRTLSHEHCPQSIALTYGFCH